MELSWFYDQDYLDLQDCSSFGQLFFIDLTYYENGQDIVIPAFKFTSIDTIDELDYFNKNFTKHVARVRKWMDWLQDMMKNMTKTDYDGYKDIAKEEWDDDEDLQEEYPDFDDYYKHYTSTQGFWDMISEDQRMSWESLKDEHEEAFRYMEKQMSEFFDNYDNVLTRSMDNYLNEAEEEIKTLVKELEDEKYNFKEWNEDELRDFIQKPFE